jgi:transcriptional regulator with XRE-family HTH domain
MLYFKCYKNITLSIDFSCFCDKILVRRNGGAIMNEMLGSRIKALRIAKNFTQEQIADQIGVSRQKYARIESGVNSITLDILSKVAEVLDVTVGDITRVLDEAPAVAYRAGEENGSSKKIFDMLDLFYANKHMCAKLQNKDMI